MIEVLKSKGIICFLAFVVLIGFISANTLNSMNDGVNTNNILFMNE